VLLRACVVPRPEQRSAVSAILRELALAEESLSTQQLAELLDPPVRPSVADLRAWLRRLDGTVVDQSPPRRLYRGPLRVAGLSRRGRLLRMADPTR
jgi:hypothetical protein